MRSSTWNSPPWLRETAAHDLAAPRPEFVHRDNLTSVLWPESGTDTARRNLYSLWSQLRKTLALQDGSCPYVVRTRESLSLDMRYTCTDIERLAVICRKLLFEEVDVPTWGELYVELERDFASELLPRSGATRSSSARATNTAGAPSMRSRVRRGGLSMGRRSVCVVCAHGLEP